MSLDIENLKLFASFSRLFKNKVGIRIRKHHSFVFHTEGYASYEFDDVSLTANKGEVIFIPKDIPYQYIINQPEKTKYTSVYFEAHIENPKPQVYSFKNFSESNFICGKFPKLLKLGTRFEKYKCYSVFYNFYPISL